MALTLEQRRRKLFWSGATGILLAALIMALLNVLGNWAFLRFDLTRQGAYSLSPASRKLVKELSDPVIVKAFFTPDLPAPYNIFERYTRDLLTEYRSASRGRVRFEFALQSPPGEFEKRAGEAGLMPIQFEQMGSDQFQVRRGYMGLVLHHRDKSETIPIVKDVQQLEYELTSRIAKMSDRIKKTIAITSGHGEVEWQGGARPSPLAQDLGELYHFITVSLPSAATGPLMADALLVIGPKQKLDDRSLWAIDQAIMRGIPTAFFVDTKTFIPGRFQVIQQDAGLHDLLKHYGIQLGSRLIYDAQCETIAVTQNMSGFAFSTSLRYPYIPQVDRIMNTHPIGRGLETVGLPFVTSVEPVQSMLPEVKFTPLLYSSPKSWFAPEQTVANVAPNNLPTPKPEDPHGPYSVGGLLDGTFPSFFQSKPIPFAQLSLIGTSPKTQIFVLGTARILDPTMPALPGADGLLNNVLTFLSKDETLIGIRSKGDIIRPLKPVSSPVRQVVRYGTVLGTALLPILFGLWRWRKRQAWRKTMA